MDFKWADLVVPFALALPGTIMALWGLRKTKAEASETITQTALSLIQPLKDENERLKIINEELNSENKSLKSENVKLAGEVTRQKNKTAPRKKAE